MPVHLVLRRGCRDPEFAATRLGALFSLLCPNTLDLEVDSRRLRLARTQGEFLLLLLFIARFHDLYAGASRYKGFSASSIAEEVLATFPRSIVPEERRHRTYWNGVLARAEVDSTYRPQRKLWRREKVGHYVPSDVALRVAGENGQPDAYVPLPQLLGLDLIEPQRFGTPPAAERALAAR